MFIILDLDEAKKIVQDYADIQGIDPMEALEWMEASYDDLDNDERAALNYIFNEAKNGTEIHFGK